MSQFLNSSLVVWRESFEAMLVVFLVWMKLKEHPQFLSIKKSIIASVSLGIVVSVLLGGIAMLSQELFDSQTLIVLQAVLPVVAALLMLQMILWMSKHSIELKDKINTLTQNKWSVSLSAFLLIFVAISREGFETVVFLSGLSMSLQTQSEILMSIGGGLIVGLILSLLTVGLMRLSQKIINLKFFFFISNLILLYIASDMLIIGLSQLIDLEWIPLFDVKWAKWIFVVLGVYLMKDQIISLLKIRKNLNKITVAMLAAILFQNQNAKADFNFLGYGQIDYKKFQTFKTTNNYEPYFREQFDLTEFALEGEYIINNGNELEFEIEIEHGGTGTAYEFEPLEEFGEFESEVEKGGEVVLSEFNYFKRFNSASGIRIGKFPLMIGLGSVVTNPNNNISYSTSVLEERMIPVGWNEIGAQFEYKWNDIRGRFAVVNGLNSEFFRTYNWVGGGYQRHFEEINADNKAYVLTLEYGNVEFAQGLAVSYYQGDTTKNRYKLDKLAEASQVSIYSILGQYRINNFTLMGQYVKGKLQNAASVIEANTTLGGLAKPKAFASLGSEAELRTLQVAYDINDLLAAYVRHEYVNTFAQVDESITALPRYEVTYNAWGLRWIIDETSQLKFENGFEKTKLDGLPETKLYALSFVTQFQGLE